MNLFSKEKSIILLILNAVLTIWILIATVITISNVTLILVEDYKYTYDEYELLYCNFDYDTKEECENNYEAFYLDQKFNEVENKRNVIISVSNLILVTGVLFVLNKKKNN